MRDKKLKLQEFIVNFLVGAILGGPMGFGIWASFVKGNLMHGSNRFNSYPAACFFIGGGAFLGGLLLAFYKGPRGYW